MSASAARFLAENSTGSPSRRPGDWSGLRGSDLTGRGAPGVGDSEGRGDRDTFGPGMSSLLTVPVKGRHGEMGRAGVGEGDVV